MDRLLHLSLNAIKHSKEDSSIRSNNLANVNVPGFRKDIEPPMIESSFLKTLESFETRAFSLREGKNRFDDNQGRLDFTENEKDVAINGSGYFLMMPENNEPALSRRGDFRVDQDGFLVDGAGNKILNQGLQPIVHPPYRQLVIGNDGRITIEPLDGEPGQRDEIGFIGTIQAEVKDLKKSGDGNIRFIDNRDIQPDQLAEIAQGYLETSNVNPTEELVEMLHRQRHYELNVRLMSIARELDESGASIMRLPR